MTGFGSPGSNAWLLRRRGDIRNGKEAQQHQRLASRISRDVLFSRGNQQCVAGLQMEFAAVGKGGALPRQRVNAFLKIGMMMRHAERIAGLGHRNLHQPQRQAFRATFARNNLQRFASGKSKLLGLTLLEQSGHQRTLLTWRISAVPP